MPTRAGHRVPIRLDVPGPRAGLQGRTAPGVVRALLVIVFVVVSVAAGVAGRPPRQVPASGAEDYLAADGDRTILTGARSTQVRWTGQLPGIRPFVDGPPSFVLAAVAADEDARTAAWMVESEDDSTGTHPHLMRLDTDGLRTWAATWPEEWSFAPGRLEIPAAPHAGQHLTTTGTATSARGQAAYSSTLDIRDAAHAGPGCLEFRRTDRIGEAAEVTTSRTRCPGRGVVAFDLPAGSWAAVPAWPPGADPRAGVDLAEAPGAALTGLRPQPLTLRRQQVVSLVPPAAAPHVVGRRIVIPSQQSGNVAWIEGDGGDDGADRGEFRVGPWLSAGGDVITAAQCGEVTVVATSQRRLLAHDRDGRWLWTTELADVAGSRPVRSGDQLLVATKDSALNAVSCRDGTIAWTARQVVSVQPPDVGPVGVLVAGDGGVRLLDPASGQTRWERSLPEKVTALAQLGELALVADDLDQLFVIDAATGDLRRAVRLPDGIEALHGLGDTVVVRGATRMLGLDRDANVRWDQPFDALGSLADDEVVVAADVEQVIVLDRDGAIVDRTQQPLNPASSQVFLTRTPDGFLQADSFGTLVRWRRP